MVWAIPAFERKDVDAAGRLLSKAAFPVTEEDPLLALEVLNNWRSSHSYPLNTFQITLRRYGKKIERGVIVAQRIKRLESIHAKLTRQRSMRMSQMQDIAGCRAVMKSLSNVHKLVSRYKSSRFDHTFRGEKDYINHPKADGYRSYHMVYDYKGTETTADYTGLKVEVQIRTQLQHAWATAVEAVGTFTRQALKSSQGDSDWLRFFSLMGTAIAAIEKTPPVPGTPTAKAELTAEIEALSQKLRVREMLTAYNTSIQHLGAAKDAKYFLLQLEPTPEPGKITVWRYKAKQSGIANQHYTSLEGQLADGSSTQIVLVSVENINALRRAYPNYFLDTNVFSGVVEKVRNGDFPDPLPQQTTAHEVGQRRPSHG